MIDNDAVDMDPIAAALLVYRLQCRCRVFSASRSDFWSQYTH